MLSAAGVCVVISFSEEGKTSNLLHYQTDL